MKRDDFSIYDASEQDIERLDDWYILAGGRPGDAKDRENLLRSKESGVLGRAVGNTSRENLERLLTTPFEDWFYARTAVKALRVKDETVGMMVVGAHKMLWERLAKYSGETLDMNDLDSWPDWARSFTGTALRTAKLHLVAVSPDLQGRGYGSRLVKRALKISERGSTFMLHGQFQARRQGLASFYSKHGFKVYPEGEPLPIGMLTGNPTEVSTPPEGDAFFVKHWRP